MANWAEIDENNVVTRVVVTSNDEPDEGYGWLVENLGGTWIQTSYNNNIRKNYAGVGFTYDADLDAFIGFQPYPSWVLDTETCKWIAPIEKPEGEHTWDEDNQVWVEDIFMPLD